MPSKLEERKIVGAQQEAFYFFQKSIDRGQDAEG